jgi:hypothetical protein
MRTCPLVMVSGSMWLPLTHTCNFVGIQDGVDGMLPYTAQVGVTLVDGKAPEDQLPGPSLPAQPDLSAEGRVSSAAGPVVPGGPRQKGAATKARTNTPVAALARAPREQGEGFRYQEGRRRQMDAKKNLGRGENPQGGLKV